MGTRFQFAQSLEANGITDPVEMRDAFIAFEADGGTFDDGMLAPKVEPERTIDIDLKAEIEAERADPPAPTIQDYLDEDAIRERVDSVTDSSLLNMYEEKMENMSMEDVRASNIAFLNDQYGKTDNLTVDANRDAYMDIDGSTDADMYNALAEMRMPSIKPINPDEILKDWNNPEYGEDFVSELRAKPRLFSRDRWQGFLHKKQRHMLSWLASGQEEGGSKLALSAIDFFPSMYRGGKELVSMETFDIPPSVLSSAVKIKNPAGQETWAIPANVLFGEKEIKNPVQMAIDGNPQYKFLDKVSEVTGGLKKDAMIKQEMAIDELKEYNKPMAGAMVALDAVGETLVFLSGMKKLGLRYGGNTTANMSRGQKAIGTLKHAQKMALLKAVTAEDASIEDRAKTWVISNAYLSTPAWSGQAGTAIGAKVSDFFLNSVISAVKEGGYADLATRDDMDDFDKLMEAINLAGADFVFSAITKSYKDAGKKPPVDFERMAHDIAVMQMNPRNAQLQYEMNPVDQARMGVVSIGRGGVKVDQAKFEAKITVEGLKMGLDEKLAEEWRPQERPDLFKEDSEAPEKFQGRQVDDNIIAVSGNIYDAGFTPTVSGSMGTSARSEKLRTFGSDVMSQMNIRGKIASTVGGWKDSESGKFITEPSMTYKLGEEVGADQVERFASILGMFAGQKSVMTVRYNPEGTSAVMDVKTDIGFGKDSMEQAARLAGEIGFVEGFSIKKEMGKLTISGAVEGGKVDSVVKNIEANDQAKSFTASPCDLKFIGGEGREDARQVYETSARQWMDEIRADFAEKGIGDSGADAFERIIAVARAESDRAIRVSGTEPVASVEGGKDISIKEAMQTGSPVRLKHATDADDFTLTTSATGGNASMQGAERARYGQEGFVPRIYLADPTYAEGIKGENIRTITLDPSKIYDMEADKAGLLGGIKDPTAQERAVFDAGWDMIAYPSKGAVLSFVDLRMDGAPKPAPKKAKPMSEDDKLGEAIKTLEIAMNSDKGASQESLNNFGQFFQKALASHARAYDKAMERSNNGEELSPRELEVIKAGRNALTDSEMERAERAQMKAVRKAIDVAEKQGMKPEDILTQMRTIFESVTLGEGRQSVKQSIEETIPLKSLSQKADVTEAEVLRTVLRESHKSVKGTKRRVIDKITANNKVMKAVIDDMPPKLRDKMISSAMNVAKKQSDEAQARAMEKFVERATDLISKEERKQANATLNKSFSGARKLIGSGTLTIEAEGKLSTIMDAIERKPLTVKQLKSLEEAEKALAEEKELTDDAKDLIELANLKSTEDMTPQEIVLMADRVDALVKKTKELKSELKRNYMTKAENDTAKQFNLIALEKPNPFFGNKYTDEGKLVTDWTKTQKVLNQLGKYDDMAIVPRQLARRLDFNDPNGMFSTIQKQLEQSYADVYRAELELMKPIVPVEGLLDKLGYEKNKGVMSFGDLQLGVADRLRIWLAKQDPETWEAAKEVGFKKGHGLSKFEVDDALFDRINSHMIKDGDEMRVANAVLASWRMMGGFINERSMSMHGYEIARNPDYAGARLRIGSGAQAKKAVGELEAQIDMEKGEGFNEKFKHFMLGSSGMFQQRTDSKASLLLYNPIKTLKHSISLVSRYYGQAEILRDANRRILYASREDGVESLKDLYHEKGRGSTYNAFAEYIRDMNTPFGKVHDITGIEGNKFVNFMAEYTAGRSLKINPKVNMYQVASFEVAQPYMSKHAFNEGKKVFSKYFALAQDPTKDSAINEAIKEMSERSPYLWNRYNGDLIRSLGSMQKSKTQRVGMGGIKRNDASVIYSIFKGIEADVLARNKGISYEDLNRKIEKQMIDVIIGSQPSFEAVSRPNLSRSSNAMMQRLTMFYSQRLKLQSMMLEGVAPMHDRLRNGERLTNEDLKHTAKMIWPVFKSQMIISAIMLGADEFLAEATKDERDIYMDFDEQYAEYLAKRYAEILGINMLGAGGIWTGVVSTLWQGYEMEAVPVKSFVEDALATAEVMDQIAEGRKAGERGQYWEWEAENRMKNLDATTRMANVAVMPLTGQNLPNWFKWAVEAPLGAVEAATDIERPRKVLDAQIARDELKGEAERMGINIGYNPSNKQIEKKIEEKYED